MWVKLEPFPMAPPLHEMLPLTASDAEPYPCKVPPLKVKLPVVAGPSHSNVPPVTVVPVAAL